MDGTVSDTTCIKNAAVLTSPTTAPIDHAKIRIIAVINRDLQPSTQESKTSPKFMIFLVIASTPATILPRTAAQINTTNASAFPKHPLISVHGIEPSPKTQPLYHNPKNAANTKVTIGIDALGTCNLISRLSANSSVSKLDIGLAPSAKTFPVVLALTSASYIEP